jgi:hypothetical protein
MVDEPSATLERTARRASLTAADLVIGVLLAWIAHVGLGLGVWGTLAFPLAYHAVGRLISDEPLLYWLYLRMRQPATPAPQETESGEVAVRDTARTAA